MDASWRQDPDPAGLERLRRALALVLGPAPLAITAGAGPLGGELLLTEAPTRPATEPGPLDGSAGAAPGPRTDAAYAVSSADDEAVGRRLIALVELARSGDKEAFGQLFDHYHGQVYRFLYYRVGSTQLAEDLSSETFFRALRSMSSFTWQGKDFGAWLMTIARNLTHDHFKAGRTRLEQTTEDLTALDRTEEGPEDFVLTQLTNEALVEALGELPDDQRDCLVMRFLQGMSIAETADVLGRTSGAVKQLQLRAVRNLGNLLPDGLR